MPTAARFAQPPQTALIPELPDYSPREGSTPMIPYGSHVIYLTPKGKRYIKILSETED